MGYKNKTILFGGDLYVGDETFSVSSQIIDNFNKADYAILNLESPVVPLGKKLQSAIKAGPVITQQENVVELLKKLKVQHVSGANNHIFDYGVEGLNVTTSMLNKNSIASAGFGKNIDGARNGIVLENSNISIVCTCEEEFGIAEKNMSGSYSMYSEDIIDQIKQLSYEGKLVIIYAHGGGEKIPLPSPYIHKRYRQFVDAGAKLVVAHHPHVIQGSEEYHGSRIFYSLGNFIHAKYPQSYGMLLKVEINNEHKILNIETINIQLKNKNLDLSADDKVLDYISLVNKVLANEESFLKIIQEQSLYMYEGYYRNYFTGLFIENLSLKIKLYKLIKRLLHIRKSNIGKKQRDEYTLLHLLRNNSHKDFIEMALKLRTNETKDLRDQGSHELWLKLVAFTKK